MIAVQPFMAHADIPVFVADLTPLQAQLQLARMAIDELRESHPLSPNPT